MTATRMTLIKKQVITSLTEDVQKLLMPIYYLWECKMT